MFMTDTKKKCWNSIASANMRFLFSKKQHSDQSAIQHEYSKSMDGKFKKA